MTLTVIVPHSRECNGVWLLMPEGRWSWYPWVICGFCCNHLNHSAFFFIYMPREAANEAFITQPAIAQWAEWSGRWLVGYFYLCLWFSVYQRVCKTKPMFIPVCVNIDQPSKFRASNFIVFYWRISLTPCAAEGPAQFVCLHSAECVALCYVCVHSFIVGRMPAKCHR